MTDTITIVLTTNEAHLVLEALDGANTHAPPYTEDGGVCHSCIVTGKIENELTREFLGVMPWNVDGHDSWDDEGGAVQGIPDPPPLKD